MAAPRPGRCSAADECAELAAGYARGAPFRSRIVMARHGFGRGEYKYFAYPLPELVEALRTALYPPLAEIANRWNEAMGIDVRYPGEHAAFLARCHDAGQTGRRRCCCSTGPATTTACTRTSTASTSSRCRWPSCCPSPGDDFAGGEFVLTEQRPRMQSRAEVVPLRQGEAVISGPPSAGAGGARNLSRQHAARREPASARDGG